MVHINVTFEADIEVSEIAAQNVLILEAFASIEYSFSLESYDPCTVQEGSLQVGIITIEGSIEFRKFVCNYHQRQYTEYQQTKSLKKRD